MSDVECFVVLTDEQIKLFHDEFKKWQKHIGLEHIEIYFDVQDNLQDIYSDISYSYLGLATLRLSKKFSTYAVEDVNQSLKRTAKHEAMHLLIGDYASGAESRYVTRDELNASNEMLVRRLEKLIN